MSSSSTNASRPIQHEPFGVGLCDVRQSPSQAGRGGRIQFAGDVTVATAPSQETFP